MRFRLTFLALLVGLAAIPAVMAESDDPQLIFKKSTVFRLLSPDAKLAVYAIDDPGVEGVACHFTVPEIGGWKGWAGLAEERSEISLACRQVGPISIAQPLPLRDEVFSERMSILFKRLRIVRVVDPKRNTLVYLTYSDRLIDGSPMNSVTAVPIDRSNAIPVKR